MRFKAGEQAGCEMDAWKGEEVSGETRWLLDLWFGGRFGEEALGVRE